MKKYLKLISTLTLGLTNSLTVLACGNNKEEINNYPIISGTNNEIIKQWSNQTSNIAKALILSKNENFNTNQLLNTILSTNDNNIKNNNSNSDNYENFKQIWGYQNNIEGITENDFISNKDKTLDNDQNISKKKINENVNKIQDILNSIKSSSMTINNPFLYNIINGLKVIIGDNIWSLNEKNIISTIQKSAPIINEIIDNLDTFNPKKVLDSYYVENNITYSLFGENDNNGWLNNYKTITGFTSEAKIKNSSILKAENFKNWDQVALFKSSIDLNSYFFKISKNKLTLGDLFNSAIKYDNGEVVDFDIKKFTTEIETIWNANINTENIINLISILIPIVKYQFLDIKPTTAITKITTVENTNKEKGIINIKDIITNIENIISTPKEFTNFITKLFFIESEKEFNLNNYAVFDFTCNHKSLSETILPIKEQMKSNLNDIYTKIIDPTIKNIYLQDILNNIKEELKNIKTNDFDFEITKIKEIINIFNDTLPFFNKITNYEDKDKMLDDWENLWQTLGLQDRKKSDFIENSLLEKLKKFLMDNWTFLENINNLLNSIKKIASSSINLLVTKETTANLDFQNEKLWTVDEKTIEFSYNENLNETTIYYNLIDKTKANSEVTYKVIIVILGKINSNLENEKQQVWLKSLKKI